MAKQTYPAPMQKEAPTDVTNLLHAGPTTRMDIEALRERYRIEAPKDLAKLQKALETVKAQCLQYQENTQSYFELLEHSIRSKEMGLLEKLKAVTIPLMGKSLNDVSMGRVIKGMLTSMKVSLESLEIVIGESEVCKTSAEQDISRINEVISQNAHLIEEKQKAYRK